MFGMCTARCWSASRNLWRTRTFRECLDDLEVVVTYHDGAGGTNRRTILTIKHRSRCVTKDRQAQPRPYGEGCLTY